MTKINTSVTVSGTNEKKDRAYIDFTINGETSNLTLSFTKLVSVQKIMVMLYNKGEIEMQRINEKYQYKTTPISNSEAIISRRKLQIYCAYRPSYEIGIQP